MLLAASICMYKKLIQCLLGHGRNLCLVKHTGHIAKRGNLHHSHVITNTVTLELFMALDFVLQICLESRIYSHKDKRQILHLGQGIYSHTMKISKQTSFSNIKNKSFKAGYLIQFPCILTKLLHIILLEGQGFWKLC